MVNFFTYNNWTGTKVRGFEMAEYLGANLNKRSDVNIHVKPPTLDNVEDGDWVDILDHEPLLDLVKERPNVNVIMLTESGAEEFKLPNKTVVIPQQHINWNREKRVRDTFTCGYIGPPSARARRHYEALGKGLNFKTCFDYKTRQDAIDFYKSIDLLIVSSLHRNELLKAPAKLINAASFGIPSIAIPLPGYKDFEGFYVPMENLIEQVEKFKDDKYYQEWSDKVLKKSEEYHISNIAKKYLCLI